MNGGPKSSLRPFLHRALQFIQYINIFDIVLPKVCYDLGITED